MPSTRHSELDSGSTSATLLSRIRAMEPEAWETLVRLYGPLVYRWARRCGLQSHDAADIVQTVFLSVARRIARFDHEGPGHSFRGWLWTVTRNAVRERFRRRSIGPRQATAERLDQWPDLLERDVEPEAEQTLPATVHRALAIVHESTQSHVWQAFWRSTIDGDESARIAADLGMTPRAVRQAKYRVLCRLRGLVSDQE